ncbi:MAG TPA: glycosyltransferase [Dissulfurispiraceae bacterium]|nr:glycosyltransferase [Dissulfurispiraceae bacterium]
MASDKRLFAVVQMSFSGLFGGREAVAFALAKILEEQIEHSMLYLVMEKRASDTAQKELLTKLDAYGIKWKLFSIEGRFSWKLIRELAASLKQDRVQIVHCHCLKSAFFSLVARSVYRLPVKIVFTLHGLPLSNSPSELFLHGMNLLSVLGADSIIGCCRQRVQSYLSMPWIKNKVSVIQNGYLMPLHPSVPAHREPANDSAVTIGMVVRLSPEKNIPLFLQAVEHITKDGLAKRPIRCLIAGDGELREPLQETIHRLELERTVTLTGFVADMDAFYKTLDILVLTSDYEGTPMCILEGMAHRLAIVASSVGGVVDLLDHNVTGSLFSAGNLAELIDRIIALIDDQQKRETLGASAFQRLVDCFSAEAWRDRHISLYACLLSGA